MSLAHTFRNEPFPLDNRWCSECGEQTCAQCTCGVKFVGKGKFAEIAVQKHPRMSGDELAKKYPGISRKTFDRARERIGTNDRMTTQTSDGREYPRNREKPDLKIVSSDLSEDERGEAEEQQTIYEVLCRYIEELSYENRKRYFTFLKRKYSDDFEK